MTTSPREISAKPAVTLLRRTCKKVAEVEANVELLTKMTKNSVATNDVRGFVCNQTNLRKVNKGFNKKTIKRLMKEKLDDSCSQLSNLKQRRTRLRKEVQKLGAEGRKALKECDAIAKVTKTRHREKNERKYNWNSMKQDKLELEDCVPDKVKEIVEGVNVFNVEMVKEEAIGPMVCSKDIELNPNELAFLKRGPRYMMRKELDLKEFLVDLEKMVVKNGYNDYNKDEDDGEDEDVVSTEMMEDKEEEERVRKAVEQIETESRMIYNKQTNEFDMGNLKATDYKFNKYVCMPKPKSVQSEAMNEVRKLEMVKAFCNAKNKIKNE